MVKLIRRLLRFLGIDLSEKKAPTIAKIHTLLPNELLDNRNIIITGGNRGLGLAIAQRCLSNGANILICGRDKVTLQSSAEKLHCQWRELNMLDIDSFKSFIEDALSENGFNADTLICNAGISLHEPDFFDVTPDSFDKQIGTNLRGPFFLAQTFADVLLKRNKPGNILFVSSETGETPDIRPYGWTKAATNSMVKGLAYRLSKNRIRINAIAPGVTATEMTGFSCDDLTYLDNPNGRVYLPEEMAEIAAFLISDLAGSISGQIITCNNAKTINARWRK